MRYEIVANKNNDTVYFKTFNKLDAYLKEWELKMQGYSTKMIVNEK